MKYVKDAAEYCDQLSAKWKDSTAPEELVMQIWPQHVRAYWEHPQNRAEMPSLISIGQHGIDLKIPRVSHYVTGASPNINICPEEVNPDRDLHHTGVDPCLTMSDSPGGSKEVNWYTSTNMLQPLRMLERSTFCSCISPVAQKQEHPTDFGIAWASLRRNRVRFGSTANINRDQSSRWMLPPTLLKQMLGTAIIQTEWFTSPLDTSAEHPTMQAM